MKILLIYPLSFYVFGKTNLILTPIRLRLLKKKKLKQYECFLANYLKTDQQSI